MISRITKRMQLRGEGGFTLIELLVVIIIIAILAAIAIPMYLSQREKGYIATMQSDLRNAAVAMESGYTTGSTYVLVVPTAEGYHQSSKVTLSVKTSTATSYCLQASYAGYAPTYRFQSSVGNPELGACP